MKLEQFIDQFELVTDAEEGLEQLRKIVLDEAVKGNITKQISDDEPAEKLLVYIKGEKQRLYDEGEIRKPKDLPEISEDEIPYDLPDEWKWARFGNIAYDFVTGVQRPKKDQDPSYTYPYVKMNNITSTGQLDLSDLVYVQATSDEVEKYELMNGDFLFNTRNSEELVGKTCVFRDGEESPYLFNNNILRVDFGNSLSSDYINYWFNSNICNVLLDRITSATTNVAAIYQKDLLKLFVPIPPIEEQQRIVQKIETLFTQVDELEQKVQQDQEVDKRLQVAVLDDLQSAKTPKASRKSWQRLTYHFDQIYRKPEHIDHLKQAILNEAIRGRLVPRDPNDEPAEKLLERIKEEKQRLYKEGEIRKPKDLPEIADEEIPYELPEGWTWCRFGKTALQISDVNHKMPDEVKKGIPYVSPSDFYGSNEIDFAGAKKISQKSFDELSKKIRPELNDLIFPRYGTIGVKNRLVNTEIDFLASYSCAIIKNLKGYIDPKYTYYYSVSPLIQADIELHTNKTTQPNVGINSIKEFRFPLPPYTEQNRIVNRIEEFFIWCDDLKVKLSRSQQTDQRLLEALMNGHADEEQQKRTTDLNVN